MLFGPQRGSAFTIFDKFAGTFALPIAVFLLALLFGSMNDLLENGVVLAIVLITPVVRLFNYLFTYYSIDEEKFHVRSGLFNKKHLELPLDRITTVDFTQNLIFQWLGVYSIKVDNASNYGGNGAGKVELALKRSDALQVRELLLSKNPKYDGTEAETGSVAVAADIGIAENADNPSEITIVPAKNILIMGALQSKSNAVAQVVSMLMVLGGMVNMMIGRELGFTGKIIDSIMSISGIGIAAILIVLFIVLSTILGAAFALIKYYGFRIRNSEESIFLEYGLFTKKSQSLLKEKISGVEFVQSLPMRLFKLGYLNVLAVGYGDLESGEKAMLYPLVAEAKADAFVSRYIPEIDSAAEYEKPLKHSLRYFFICPRLFFALILFGAAAAAEHIYGFIERSSLDISFIWALLVFLIILAVLSVIAEYNNTRVCAGEKNVHFVAGGFTRIKTAVKTVMIESVSDTGSIPKRNNGIISIKMGILAPEIDSVQVVRNMHFHALESIRKVMHY